MIRAAIMHGAFDPQRELAELMTGASDPGGVVSFVGLARGEDGQVTALTLKHHPVLTQRSLDEIATEALTALGVDAISVVHRAGRVLPNEPIVFAGAAARNRREAFLATAYLMDMLKTRAVFWKREEGPDGVRWIEPREADLADAARWGIVGDKESSR